MPEFLSLSEAAHILGVSEDELKDLARRRQIKAYMDGGSWRFRKADVEEESRRRGMGTDAELPLSDLDLDVQQGGSASGDDIDLAEFQLGVASPDPGIPSPEMKSDGRDDDILLDDRSLPPHPAESSTMIGMRAPSGELPSDTDVRLVPDNPEGASDSDVHLSSRGGRDPSDSDATLVFDEVSSSEEVQAITPAEFSAPRTEADDEDTNAALLQPGRPPAGSSEELPVLDDSDSDFELTPSSVIDALEPESGSDFHLTALDSSSDEFEATPLGGPSDSDVTGAVPSSSGVNLGRPSDSGINLLAVSGFDLGSSDSIELAPLDDEGDARPEAPKPAPKRAAKAPEKPKAPQPEDLSATPLPKKDDQDIFEDTDFDVDVDAIDSGEDDRTVLFEAQSDFDVDDSVDSSSEVFAIDTEDVDENAATALGPAMAVADDEGEGISGETDAAWDIEEMAAPAASSPSRPIASPFVATGGPGPEWGGLWVGLLSVAAIFMLLLAFVGMDLVRNLYYFQGNTPASGLIQQIAGMIGGGS